MNNLQANTPVATFKHTMTMRGLPTVTALNVIGGLMSVYQVVHDFPVDNLLTGEAAVTGDDYMDAENMASYSDLKNILDAYAREYTRVQASAQLYGPVIIITFTCW